MRRLLAQRGRPAAARGNQPQADKVSDEAIPEA
jgi:hypothetical protein